MDVVLAFAVAAFILLGPWVVALRALRKTQKNAEDAEDRWNSLQSRMRTIDGLIAELRAAVERSATPAAAQDAAPTVASAEVAVGAAAANRPEVNPISAPAAIAPPPQVEIPIPAAAVAATAPAIALIHSVPTPVLSSVLPPACADANRVGLEEKVGTNWLNKIGIVLLVLGVAFLISTLMRTLGPAGKVLVGLAVACALLGAGVFCERIERYRVLARAGIGGGWALLFFTVYAMHHVAAARVIQSQTLDLALMMAVAAAMVWHTLRYDSQVVTGLAFLLAFATVNIGRGSVFSLTAGVILAAALCVLVVRRGWFELEIFAILATYLNHLFWLWPIIEPMAGHHRMFPQFLPSATILACYWLIFRISYIVRDTSAVGSHALELLQIADTSNSQAAEAVSTFSALLNGGLLLAIMRYQSVHPELAFWFLLGLGFAELLLAQLPVTRRRRSAFVVLTVIGAALLVAAIPFRYTGMSLAVLWIAEAQALLLAGVGTDERVFRRLGLLAMIPPAVTLVFRDAGRAAIAPDPKLALVCAFAAIACYFDAEALRRKWPALFGEKYEAAYLIALSHAGAILAMVAIWAGLHDAWVGTAWAVLGFALAIAGNRLRASTLATQANILAAAALVRAITVNVELTGTFHAVGLRLITVGCIAALLYLSSPWTAVERRGRIPSAYTWAASFLVSLLAWYELRPVSVAVAWALFGVLLLELGLTRRMRDLSMQALVALAAAFIRILFVNLNAGAPAGQISPRVYTVIPLAVIFYYCYERLRSADAASPEGTNSDWQRRFASPALCWFGAISIAGIARFEINVDWVVAIWAAGAVAFLLVARSLHRSIFLHQALAAAVAVLFRGVFHNFYERSYFVGHWAGDSKAVVIAATLLLASLPLAFTLRGRRDSTGEDAHWFARALLWVESQPQQLLFFVPLMLITALLAIELRSGMITVAWGIEGVIVFIAALFAGERSYRLSGLGLLLLCVGKILVIDVWRMQGTDRYLTLIITGSALLLVSFLYSRYREALREYL